MYNASSHPRGRSIARITAHASGLSNVLEPFKRLRTTNDKLPSPGLVSLLGNARTMRISMVGLRPRDASILGGWSLRSSIVSEAARHLLRPRSDTIELD